MTDLKVPITGAAWGRNLRRAIAAFRDRRHFLFSAYPDADALGAMLALSLYLHRCGKKATLFLPKPIYSHLQILEEIIQYNEIEVITEGEALDSLQGRVDTLVFCDTANARLVPFLTKFQKRFLEAGILSVEIDHHFGNDSSAIVPDGIHLFRRANASTEIVAELLQEWHHSLPGSPAPFDYRNIVISLLMGLQADTFGGKALQVPRDYEHWNRLLADRLGESVMAADSHKRGGASRFRRPEEILDHLSRLSPEQKKCVEELKKRIVCYKGVAELDLLDSALANLTLRPSKNNTGEFFQIWNAMANVVPQVGGKLGLFYFNGVSAEGDDCIYIKLRRAFDFHRFDLRQFDELLKSSFGNNFQGGGGHSVAVSFRIHPMKDPEFKERISGLIHQLQDKVQ